jgi:hypothetical protein
MAYKPTSTDATASAEPDFRRLLATRLRGTGPPAPPTSAVERTEEPA